MCFFLLGCANTERTSYGDSWFNDFNQLIIRSNNSFSFDTALSDSEYDIKKGLLNVEFGDHIDTVVKKFGKPQSINANKSYEVEGVTLNYGASSYFKVNLDGDVVGIKVFNLDLKKLMLSNGVSFGNTKEEAKAVFSRYKIKRESDKITTYVEGDFTYSLYFYRDQLASVTLTKF